MNGLTTAIIIGFLTIAVGTLAGTLAWEGKAISHFAVKTP